MVGEDILMAFMVIEFSIGLGNTGESRIPILVLENRVSIDILVIHYIAIHHTIKVNKQTYR